MAVLIQKPLPSHNLGGGHSLPLLFSGVKTAIRHTKGREKTVGVAEIGLVFCSDRGKTHFSDSTNLHLFLPSARTGPCRLQTVD